MSELQHLQEVFDLLRIVDIEDSAAVRLVLKNMERLGWVKFVGEEEFRFLRPFHRVFDKCLGTIAPRGGHPLRQARGRG